MTRRFKRPAYLYPTNAVFRTLSRMGVRLGAINILTVVGRTTGQPRSTPVSPVRVEGRRFLLAPMPQAGWVHNARATGHGQLTDGTTVEHVVLHEVDDGQLRRRIMAAFPAQVPHGVRLFKAVGLVKSKDPKEFTAAADLVVAFEVLPAPT